MSKTEITLTELKNIAYINGYVVLNFSSTIAKLYFAVLGLSSEAKKAKGLTIIDPKGEAIIFIDDNQPNETQLFALAHEMGHIVLNHKENKLTPEQQEKEAEQFANAILSKGSVKI